MQQSCHREDYPRLFVHIQGQNGVILGSKVHWTECQLPRGKLYIGLLFLVSFLTGKCPYLFSHCQIPNHRRVTRDISKINSTDLLKKVKLKFNLLNEYRSCYKFLILTKSCA